MIIISFKWEIFISGHILVFQHLSNCPRLKLGKTFHSSVSNSLSTLHSSDSQMLILFTAWLLLRAKLPSTIKGLAILTAESSQTSDCLPFNSFPTFRQKDCSKMQIKLMLLSCLKVIRVFQCPLPEVQVPWDDLPDFHDLVLAISCRLIFCNLSLPLCLSQNKFVSVLKIACSPSPSLTYGSLFFWMTTMPLVYSLRVTSGWLSMIPLCGV